MNNIEIHESEIQKEDGGKAKLAILRTSSGSPNPIDELDTAVHYYVQNTGYHQFIEIHLDNPWIRVILSDINELHFDNFKKDEHRLNKFK